MNAENIAVRFYNEIREQGAQAIRQLADLAEERGDVISRDGEERLRTEILRETADRFEANKFVIAVVGEFSRGKTSLINVLLQRPDLLPTAIEPSTAAITLLHYSEEEYARVTYTDGSIIEPVAFFDLPQYVMGKDLDGKLAATVPGRRLARVKTQEEADAISLEEIGEEYAAQLPGVTGNSVKYVDVFVASPFLKDGVTLVDTPGIGSVNPEHGEATRQYISKADAVIFLINTDPVISESECNFLMFLQDYIEQFIFAVTKIDRFSESEQKKSLRYTKHIIEEYAGIEHPLIYPISARLMEEGETEGDETKIRKSRFPEFRLALEHYLIRERGRHVLQSTAREVRTQLNDIINSIESELRHLSLSGEEIEQRRQVMEKGLHDAQYVRDAISHEVGKTIRQVGALVEGEFDWLRAKTALSDEIDTYGWNDLRRANELVPLLVKTELDKALADVLTRVSEHLASLRSDLFDWAMETLTKLGEDVGFELGASQERAEWEISFKTSSNAFVRNLKKLGTMTIGSTLALTVAGLVLFGGVGAVAMVGGLLVGGGWMPFILDKTKEQLKRDVMLAIDTMMDRLMEDLTMEVVRDLNQFRDEVTQLLDGAISNVTNTVQKLQPDLVGIPLDSRRLEEELHAQLARAKEIDDALNRLRFFAGYVAGEELRSLQAQ